MRNAETVAILSDKDFERPFGFVERHVTGRELENEVVGATICVRLNKVISHL